MTQKKTVSKESKTTRETINVVLNNGVPIDQNTGNIIDIREVGKTHDIKVVDTNGEQQAVGVAINTYDKTATEYLRDLKEFNFSTDNLQDQIKLCNKLYKMDGTISTALDVLIDFTTSKFTLDKVEDKHKGIFDNFTKSVNQDSKLDKKGIRPLLQQLALEWFVSGNVFPYSTWKKVEIDGSKYFMPIIIQLLNPIDIGIPRGFFDKTAPVYIWQPYHHSSKIKSLTTQQLFMTTDSINTYLNQLGDDSIKLQEDRIYHLKRRARSYDIWGIPYLVKTFSSVAAKMKLKALDNATTEGLIGYLTIFKLGSPDKDSPYHVVPAARLNAFAGLLKYPQASTTLIWPHDIEVETTGPDGKILDFENKYDEVNSEIIKALGVPQILLDGKGTATASWVAILSLVERLERVREALKDYMDHLLSQIKERNKIKSDAEFSWSPINLRDEKMVKTLLMSFYDKGLLPIRSTLKEGGYDPNAIIEEMKIEKKDNAFDKLFERRDIPFSAPTGSQEPKTPSKKDNGRPKEKKTLADENYIIQMSTVFNDFRNRLTEQPKLVNSGLMLMKTKMEQIIEDHTSTHLDSDNVFAIKVNTWNGKYLDKFVDNLKSEIGGKPNEFNVEDAFIKFEARLNLFSTESMKNIDLAILLHEKKEQGMTGAVIKVNPDSECDSCKSLGDNWYSLEDIFNILPVHPNQSINLEFTESDLVIDGVIINTPVVKHPKNFSKIL